MIASVTPSFTLYCEHQTDVYVHHSYSFLLLLSLTFLLIHVLKSILCNHSRLYYVPSQVREEVVHDEVGADATVVDRSEAFLLLMNLLYYRRQRIQNTTTGLQVIS